MENNIDTQLELAISTRNTYNESEAELYIGYSSEKSTWRLLIRYNDDTKTTSSRLYVFEKRYTDKLSACADLNMKDKIELQSFCDEIFGDG